MPQKTSSSTLIYFLMTFNTRFCFISSSVKQLYLFFSFVSYICSFHLQHRTTFGKCFYCEDNLNRQSDYQYFFLFKLLLSFSWFNFSISYFYSLLVHVDYVNYHVVIFMAHLHLNELSLICDMWLNKITYLLTYLRNHVLK